jgi:hypothetical protein
MTGLFCKLQLLLEPNVCSGDFVSLGGKFVPGQKTYIAPTLLQPDNHAVMLIDYQYLQLVTARSHAPENVIGSAVLFVRWESTSDVRL